jgi:hypothetical protein
LGIPIATATSHTSRHHAPRAKRTDESWRPAWKPWFEAGYDAVVLAHFIGRSTASDPSGEFSFSATGSSRSFARLERGVFTLEEFAPLRADAHPRGQSRAVTETKCVVPRFELSGTSA